MKLNQVVKILDSPRRRVQLLLVVTIAVLLGGYLAVDLTPFADPPIPPKPLSRAIQIDTAGKFLEQSDRFSDWTFALLAGVIAIVVTTRVHKTVNCDRLYILLGPAGALLLMSLRAAWQLQRRMTNLVAFDDFTDLPNLGTLLMIQWRLFFAALICAAFFGLSYLVKIVSGEIKPYEEGR